MKEYEEPTEEIRRYGTGVIATHWVVILLFIPLAITSLLLLRDWAFEEFNIIGGEEIVPTFEGAFPIHGLLGSLLLIVGLVHIMIHVRQAEKPILPTDLSKEFRATIRSLLWILFLSPLEERGASEKYKANQRMTYVATIYTVALAGLTGFLSALGVFGRLGPVVHIVAGILVLLLSSFRMLYLIRKYDKVAIKCILLTGRMPVWYVKENHPLWYDKISAEAATVDDVESKESGPGDDARGLESPPAESTGG